MISNKVITIWETKTTKGSKFYGSQVEAEQTSAPAIERFALKINSIFFILAQKEPISIEPWRTLYKEFLSLMNEEFPSNRFNYFEWSKEDCLERFNAYLNTLSTESYKSKYGNTKKDYLEGKYKNDLERLLKVLSSDEI